MCIYLFGFGYFEVWCKITLAHSLLLGLTTLKANHSFIFIVCVWMCMRAHTLNVLVYILEIPQVECDAVSVSLMMLQWLLLNIVTAKEL